MKRWQKITLALLLSLLLLLATIPLALPSLVRHYGGGWLQEQKGRTLTLGDLSLNLLTWSLELRDVSLSEPHSQDPFVSFDRLTVRVSPKSLFERAVIVTELELVKPQVRILRLDDRFNFADFMSSEPAPPEPAAKTETGEPLHFSLNNLKIVNGSASFIDRAGDVERQHHRVADLNLAIPFIGNTPYLADRYVTPALHAVINGAPLDLEGRLKLFTNTVEATVNLDLDNVDIPFYLALLPQPLPVAVRSGNLGTDVEIVYRTGANQEPELQVSGEARVTTLRVGMPAGGDLLFLPFLSVRLAPSKVLASQLHLDRLYIYNPEIYLDRDASGKWSFAALTTPAQPTEPPAAKPEPAEASQKEPFLATLEGLHLKNGRIVFRDQLPTGGFQTEVHDLNLDVTGFSTAPQNKTDYRLALQTDRDESLQVDGNLVLEPLAVAAGIDLEQLQLDAYTPYLEPFLTAPVYGRAGVQAQVAFNEGIVRVTDGRLELQQLATSFGGDDGLQLAKLEVTGCSFDGGANAVEIGRVELANGSLSLSRDAEGRLSALNLLREQPPAAEPATPVAPEPAPTKEATPLSYLVQEIKVGGLQVAFNDTAPKGAVHHRISDIELTLNHLAGPKPAASPFQFQAGYGRQGRLNLSGEVVAATGRLTLDSRLSRIALADFNPYLPDSLNLVLADGELDSQLKVRLDPAADGLKGDFSGDLGIRHFNCLDGEFRQELLRWGGLQFSGIRGELKPLALHIDGIALSDYVAKIVIEKNGTLNLKEVAAGEKAAAQPEAPAPEPKPEPAAAGPTPDISIDAITLQGGQVAFADHHLQPSFATTMYELGGHIGRLSSQGTEPAEVDLRGHLENLSPLQISGEINPLGKDLFADIKISFKDIELSPITPYTGTYLGYAVEKGKLFLDLKYRIDHEELQAQNKVLLDQFTFGEKVDSKEAVNLPVKLAVALLKDRQGQIKLDIPVTGRTDDPEFSVWSVVLTVLKNLLVKAATSPLSLLQAAFGGGEDFTSASFPFGSAELLPAEEKKLDKLAEALKDRPGLQLEITGFTDPDGDPEGYRRVRLQQELRQEKFRELVAKKEVPPGQTAADMQITPEEKEDYLKEVYDRATFPKPQNFLGFDKSLPADEMEKLILANTEAGSEQLANLARERATAVLQYLTVKQGLAPARLFLVRPDPGQKPKEKGASGNRVEFGLVSH